MTISHSGSTVETLTAARMAKEAEAATISIINFGKSPLLAHTDIVLNALAHETQLRTPGFLSQRMKIARHISS